MCFLDLVDLKLVLTLANWLQASFRPSETRNRDGNVPFECPKHNRSDQGVAHISIAECQTGMEYGQRDEPSEPEQHCQRVDGEDGELVRETREKAWSEREEGHGEDKGPDGDENEEADRIGREVLSAVAIIPV